MRSLTLLLVSSLACLLLVPRLAVSAEGLSPAAVKNAMRPYMQAIRACVERQRAIKAPAGESLDLSFTIGNRGKVRSVRLLTAEHAGTYLAGCAAGVIRSMKFPAFSGKPVVVPRFPVPLQAAVPAPFPQEDEFDDEQPDKPPAAPRKVRAKIVRRLRSAVPALRSCIQETKPPEKEPAKRRRHRRRRRRARKKPKLKLAISFAVNPLGRASGVEVLTAAHRTDHAAGCVTGVLSFVEFPPQQSESYTLSRVKLPPL